MVDDGGADARQRNENDDDAAAPRGIPNLSGVACHVNSALLLMAHCDLPLHPLAARHGNSGILPGWLARLRSSSSSSKSDGSDVDGPDPPLLPPIEECYGVLRASFGIEVKEVGDPVIALRKLLDMQDPALSGGVLQTTLVQTNQATLPVVGQLVQQQQQEQQEQQEQQDKNEQHDDTDHPISSSSSSQRKTRQLKPSRMPNPLPIPSHTSLADLFRTRILSNDPVPDYQWPVCDGSQNKEVVAKTASSMMDDGVAAMVGSGGETNKSIMTMRTRRIIAFPDVFMAHLPASSPRQQRRRRAMEDQSTRNSGNDDDTSPSLSSSSLADHIVVVPMRIESSSSSTTTTGKGDDDEDIVFDLVGAILHIANTDDDDEYDDDEGGHTATLIQWTMTTTTTSSSDEGGNGEKQEQHHRVWYLIDDEVVYKLAPGDAQALLEQGGPYPPMSSFFSFVSTTKPDDDETAVAFCFPVLLVYRRSEMFR